MNSKPITGNIQSAAQRIRLILNYFMVSQWSAHGAACSRANGA